MSKLEVGYLAVEIIAAVAVCLFVVAIILVLRQYRRKARCTAATVGTVVKHVFAVKPFHPIVAYVVDGQEYTVHRRYRGMVWTQNSLRAAREPVSHSGAWISKRGYIHVQKSIVTDYSSMAQELWPLGSEMEVFYDPADPTCAFAEEFPTKVPMASLLLCIMGLALLGVVAFFFAVVVPTM